MWISVKSVHKHPCSVQLLLQYGRRAVGSLSGTNSPPPPPLTNASYQKRRHMIFLEVSAHGIVRSYSGSVSPLE